MKIRAVVSALFLILLVAYPPQSHAVFGLSTCEKLKSQLNKLDESGYKLWLDYKRTVIQNYGLPETSVKTENSITKKLISVLQSDATIYLTAYLKGQCFTTTQKSQIFLAWSNTKTSILSYQNLLSATQHHIFVSTEWNNIYPEYVGFYQFIAKYK